MAGQARGHRIEYLAQIDAAAQDSSHCLGGALLGSGRLARPMAYSPHSEPSSTGCDRRQPIDVDMERWSCAARGL